jgi:hypothetical protein
MGATSKIALGVAGGYLLGRSKKLKLAVTLGGLLAGKRLAGTPSGLLNQGTELVQKNPELAKLQQDSGALLDAVKTAALTTATQRLHTLGDTLRGSPPDSDGSEAASGDSDGSVDSSEDSGEGSEDSGEGSRESAGSEEPQQGDSSPRPPAKKAASKSPSGSRKPAQKKSASKSKSKTAKKAAKKTTGADRPSSGG